MKKTSRKEKLMSSSDGWGFNIDILDIARIICALALLGVTIYGCVKCSKISQEVIDDSNIRADAIAKVKEQNNYIFPVTDKRVVTTGHWGKVIKYRIYYEIEYQLDGETYTYKNYEDVSEQVFNEIMVGDLFDTKSLVKVETEGVENSEISLE